PDPRKHLKAGRKADAPAAKEKRGEKEKAHKQAKKTAKGGDDEEGEDLPAGEEPDLEAVIPDVADDEEIAGAADIEDDDDDEDLAPAKKGGKATERKEVKDL